MQPIDLDIRPNDWLGVLGIGLFFAGILTSFIYLFLDLNVWQGGMFGVLLGACIALYSWGLFSFTNFILFPRLSQRLWGILSAFVSFLAGVLGSSTAIGIAQAIPLDLPHKLHTFLGTTIITLGLITYALGALLYQVVKMRNVSEALDSSLIHSRLASLETQLNPHFLFNALNSLAELIHIDQDKAEAMAIALSKFLRNTMSEHASITLKEELENTKSYIEIERIRYGEMIRLDFNILPQYTNLLVPKFSIQLLVENAIKHGFDGSEFTIFIEAYDKDGCLHVEVQNSAKPPKNVKYGIGLSNLQERLEHLCNGELLHTSHEGLTAFTLKLGAINASSTSR
jgi:hypothetical protein